MLAGRHFHDYAFDAGVDGPLHVVHHAARKGKNLRSQITLYDLADGGFITWRDRRHSGFNALDAGLGQSFGDANLVVLGKDHAGLLLAVAQGNVMKLYPLGEL